MNPPILPKTSHTSPQKNTPGLVLDSIVPVSISSSLTPPPVTSALRYPWCPSTATSYLVSVSSNAVRSVFFRSATRVAASTRASASSASASRLGSPSRRRVDTRALPGGDVNRSDHTSRLSPDQFTTREGSGGTFFPSSSSFSSFVRPRASGRTRWCERSNTDGPENPRWVNKNPSLLAFRVFAFFFFFFPPAAGSVSAAFSLHSRATSTDTPGRRSPPGWSPVRGTSAG